MNLIDFVNKFPDEESCKLKFKEIREQEGIKCRKCGHTEHYWKKDKEQYECKKCKARMSLKSGTVMRKSKLPFRYWFIAIHLLTSTKKSFSSKEVQRQLGHKRYQPIWHMMHKLREAMGNRDDNYELSGEMELDDGFFTTRVPDDKKEEPLKRGRGSQRKTKVLVMTESEIVDNPKPGKKKKRVGFIKMKVINDLKAGTIDNEVKQNVSKDASIKSDDSTSYVGISDIVEEHTAKVIRNEEIQKELPWVHIAISNAKRLLLNSFHSIGPEYLQKYLNEFCYNFNRRYMGDALFDRLLVACVTMKNEFRYL
ncbi:IS1595 family transposase [Marinilabiliaceae bacterium JC017]|nr:IS1595 family transposase [Marinilabiliaceae bacterium JC017]